MDSVNDLGQRFIPLFPFSAIPSQNTAKIALILNSIDPSIGGVLISGPKGSGKSLLVKSFSDMLPEIDYIDGCIYGCNPNDQAYLCPECLEKVNKCEFNIAKKPMRIIQVPLSVTDDMLLGSIDFEKVIEEGQRNLRPGLLAKANQNILYIDEVNLLPDHITDSILDSAASGWNNVEREGVSIQHPSHFILIGTMNPEEGELRPQILDRFGLFAETNNVTDPDQRYNIIDLNERFSIDPLGFKDAYKAETNLLRERISNAKKQLPRVVVPDEILNLISETCSRLRVDGFRPDIVTVKAAKALASFNGRINVSNDDIDTALNLALGHRTRRSGLTPPPTPIEISKTLRKIRSPLNIRLGSKSTIIKKIVVLPREIIELLTKRARKWLILELLSSITLFILLVYFLDTLRVMIEPQSYSLRILLLEFLTGGALFYLLSRSIRSKRSDVALATLDTSNLTLEVEGNLLSKDSSGGTSEGTTTVKHKGEKNEASPDYGTRIFSSIKNFSRNTHNRRKRDLIRLTAGRGDAGGRRAKGRSSSSRGRYAWYQAPKGKPHDIALAPTIRAAAIHQKGRENLRPRTLIKPEDLRVKVREYNAPYTIILLVDMSLSMISSIENIIETIYSFHRDVYRRRDRVGLVVFKGSKAFTIQQPTRNLELIVKKLKNMGASDFTPLPAGLLQSLKILKQEKMVNKDAVPHIIVISDGIVNVPLDIPISPLTRRKYLSEAQADSFDVAHLLSKEKIKVHIVNTNHSRSDEKSFPVIDPRKRVRFTPTQFMIELARLSGGNYKGLNPVTQSIEKDKEFIYH